MGDNFRWCSHSCRFIPPPCHEWQAWRMAVSGSERLKVERSRMMSGAKWRDATALCGNNKSWREWGHAVQFFRNILTTSAWRDATLQLHYSHPFARGPLLNLSLRHTTFSSRLPLSLSLSHPLFRARLFPCILCSTINQPSNRSYVRCFLRVMRIAARRRVFQR